MLEKARHTSALGMSLVELMVGLAVGMIVMLATLAMYTTTSISARNTLDSAKLNVEIRGAMDLMVEDIRRAGFGGDPFMVTGSTDLNIQDYDGGTANCILYSYDADTDGELSTTSAYEYFGFRIANNAVWMRDGGSGNLSSCANSPSAWQRLTDPTKVEIDERDVGAGDTPFFAIEYQCIAAWPTTSATDFSGQCQSGQSIYDWAAGVAPAALLETRQVTIDLGGALTRDATMRMELTQDVQVRNHRLVVIPAP